MGVNSKPIAETFSVEYAQFRRDPMLHGARAVAEVLAWPIVWPLAMLSQLSDILFRTFSEALSIVPYAFGVVLRGAFYRFALRRCGRNVIIDFGTVFIFRDVSIGSNVLIGRYNVIHYCDFGDYVLTADRCTFLSGKHYHRFLRTDIPMALQGGELHRISVGSDCWIGTQSVVMENVGSGSVVGAGSVVTQPVEAGSIVAGNPARLIRRRFEPPDSEVSSDERVP